MKITGHHILLLCAPLLPAFVYAEGPATLDALLEQVKQQRSSEKKELEQREIRFMKARDKQQLLLAEARRQLQEDETRGDGLKASYESNVIELQQQNAVLNEKIGSLSEMNGIVKQIASEMSSMINSSLVSAEKNDRGDILDVLTTRRELASLEELEDLWLLAMDEMVESGKIVRFPAKIVTAAGNEIEQDVTRVGVFNAISAGRFLRSLPGTGKLIEPGRQPEKRFQDMALALERSEGGIVPFPLDPTSGAMLALLVQVPDLKNRIQQGGIVGYLIILIGVIGLLITLERFINLSLTSRNVEKQLQSKTAGPNPLGRIMQVYSNNPDVDTETLGLKLDEAILKEVPRIKRGLSTLALLAAVAPLMGLLGTVTGIIETFQSITLYGTGDPRVMSGGISQALVTTVMGLLVAIPLLLFHSFLMSRSNALVQILDEKSTAFVALLAEMNRMKKNA